MHLLGRKEIKSELLEKLKDIADDADINEAIQGIEGLAKPLDITSIGLEDFKKVLESNKEVKAYYQSALDSGIGKGVATFKSETLPGIIEEELKKANNKKKTPEQLELEELKAKFEALEKEKAKADMTTKYTKVLTEKGLNTDLINFVLGENDETTTQNIESIEKIINGAVDNGVKNKLSSSSYTPPSESNVDNSLNAQIASAMGVQ